MDCSKTINFIIEKTRYCQWRTQELEADGYTPDCDYMPDCESCPLSDFCDVSRGLPCARKPKEVIFEAINAVQKWSDEHPRKTYAQDLFEKLPNAMKGADGTPLDACREALYGTKCPIEDEEIDWDNGCDENCCVGCWNEEMEA